MTVLTFLAFLAVLAVGIGVGWFMHYKFGARVAADALKIRSDVRGL